MGHEFGMSLARGVWLGVPHAAAASGCSRLAGHLSPPPVLSGPFYLVYVVWLGFLPAWERSNAPSIEETVFVCCHCSKTKSLSLFTPPHPHMSEGASDTSYILRLGFLPHAPRLSQGWAQGLRPSLPPYHQTCWLHSVQPGEKNLSAEKMQTARLGVTVPLHGC